MAKKGNGLIKWYAYHYIQTTHPVNMEDHLAKQQEMNNGLK